MKILFDIPQLYYLPQYLPVWHELEKHHAECLFVFYDSTDMGGILRTIAEKENLPAKWVHNDTEAAQLYRQEQPDWVIFGNHFPFLSHLSQKTGSALLYHGIGVKSCYFDANLMEMDIRFVEGEYRFDKLSKLYPGAPIKNVGFAKLDPLFSMDDRMSGNGFNLTKAGLDKKKPTLLYAPTFYPSSIERLDDEWPLHFKDYNLIVKPHFFTLSKKKYKKQRKKISLWEQYDNTYIAKAEDYSLIPFMKVSDLLISEASSAFFEFAALNKPIVWLDCLKLRWGYKGIFKYRFGKRMDQDIAAYNDIGAHVKSYHNLRRVVDSQIKNPDQYKEKRELYTKHLIGEADGKVSKRVVDYLMSRSVNSSTN